MLFKGLVADLRAAVTNSRRYYLYYTLPFGIAGITAGADGRQIY
jgi:hypothetical protein